MLRFRGWERNYPLPGPVFNGENAENAEAIYKTVSDLRVLWVKLTLL